MAKGCYRFFHLSSVTYLLIGNYFFKYIELQHLNHTTAPAVISTLKTCFACFGIPEEIVPNNGPPFDSKEFNDLCSYWDIVFTRLVLDMLALMVRLREVYRLSNLASLK